MPQYYTHRVLQKSSFRYRGALEVFEKMMELQDEAYRVHEKWSEGTSPEAIRYAMLAIRNQSKPTISNFEDLLQEANVKLQ